MKKSDKISIIIVSIIAVFTIFYVIKSKLILKSDTQTLYVVGLVILGALLYLLCTHLIFALILKKRINKFADLAKKYSLRHVYTNKLFFMPYGILNSLSGNIRGQNIVVKDELLRPNFADTLTSLTPGQVSCNIKTKVDLDDKNVTPVYVRKNLIYIDPFMSIVEVEKCLSNL